MEEPPFGRFHAVRIFAVGKITGIAGMQSHSLICMENFTLHADILLKKRAFFNNHKKIKAGGKRCQDI